MRFWFPVMLHHDVTDLHQATASGWASNKVVPSLIHLQGAPILASKEQQRQKKLAKKRSKEIAKKKDAAREKSMMKSEVGKLAAASSGAIERCLMAADLLDETKRFGTMFISRKLPDGKLAVGCFLVDGMCLGVKDCYPLFCFPSQFSDVVQRDPESLQTVAPELAKKFLLSVIEFARKYSFEPSPSFAKMQVLLNGIDESMCETEFSFGRDGQPVFISGPYDTDQRIGEILEKLDATAGEGNYMVDYDETYGLGDELEGTSWADDPELDADIDEDVRASPE